MNYYTFEVILVYLMVSLIFGLMWKQMFVYAYLILNKIHSDSIFAYILVGTYTQNLYLKYKHYRGSIFRRIILTLKICC